MGAETTASGMSLACTKFVQGPKKTPMQTAKAAKSSVLLRMESLTKTATYPLTTLKIPG
jgi:hypothetical protein